MRFLGLLLFLTFTRAESDDPKPCTLLQNGRYWDLNPLTAKTDYIVTSSSTEQKIYMNICRNIVTEALNLPSPELSAGITKGDRGDHSIGRVNTTFGVGSAPNTLIMTLLDGSSCTNGNGNAQTAIELVCDSSVYGPGTPRLVASLGEGCAYWIEWRTRYACSGNPPRGFSFWRFLFYS